MTDIKDDLRQIPLLSHLKRLSFSVLPIKEPRCISRNPDRCRAIRRMILYHFGRQDGGTRKGARSSRCNPGGRGYFAELILLLLDEPYLTTGVP